MKPHDKKHTHRDVTGSRTDELSISFREQLPVNRDEPEIDQTSKPEYLSTGTERVKHFTLKPEQKNSLPESNWLFDNAPLSYLVIDENGVIIQSNIAAQRLLGKERPHLTGEEFYNFIAPESIATFQKYQNTLKTCSKTHSCGVKLVDSSGDSFDARISGVAGRPIQREEKLFLNITLDTCQSTENTRKLQENVHRLSELNKLLQISIEDLPAHDLYNRVLDVVLSFPSLGRDRKGLMFIMEEDHLRLKAHNNIPEPLLANCSALRIDNCLCRKAAEIKQPLFSSPDNEEYKCCFKYLPGHSRYCVPILIPGKKVVGILTLFIDDGAPYSDLTEQVLIKSSQVIAGIINRKKIETKLQERTELLSSIYSAADSIGLVVTDLMENDARISSFSPGAENMFGYKEEQVFHQSISLLYRENEKDIIPERVKLLRQGKRVSATDMIMRKKDGTHFPVVVTINPFINDNGKTVRALSVINDISQLKAAQHELEHANTELEKRVVERTQELQLAQQQVLHAEKLAAIGQLSASIAHEFNSPLQGVMTVLKGVSKRAILEEEDLELVESAVDECNRMAQLIRDLQNFNRPSTGRCSWVNLNQILDSLLLLYKSDFHSKKIDLVKAYDDQLPAISVVPDQIRQVIINLLNNAADACETGGVITVSTRLADAAVELRINDTGHGIAPENIQRIFDPFFTTKPAVKGTGLGLSVCYGIIKSHKGVIHVDSPPDEGTQFTITLPVKRTM